MLCYKDKTFCASEVENHTCGREITNEQVSEASLMEIPIAWGDFCEGNK